jgi:selenocysteine lyase/cysteine desulfurase
MEYGTPNMVGVASLWAAQDWIKESGGIETIFAHEMVLARKLVDALKDIDGVTVYCCDDMDNHLSTITINVEGLEAGDVGIMLDVDFNIAVRTGLHCAPLVHTQLGIVESHGGVRFSIGAFNTEQDVAAAIEAVTEIAERGRQMKNRTTSKAAQ